MYYNLSVGGTKIIINAVADQGFVSSACATWDSEQITTDIGKDPLKIAKKAFLQKIMNPLLLEPDYEEYSKYYYLQKGVEQSLPEEKEVPQIEAPELLQIGYDENKYQQGWLESAQNLIGMISVSNAVETIKENAPSIGKIIGKGTCKLLTSSVERSQARQNLERGLNQIVESASSGGFFMGNLIYLAILCGIMYILYRIISSQSRQKTIHRAHQGKLLGEGPIEDVNFSNMLQFCGFSNTKKKRKSKTKKKSRRRSPKRRSKRKSSKKRSKRKPSKKRSKSKRKKSKKRSKSRRRKHSKKRSKSRRRKHSKK